MKNTNKKPKKTRVAVNSAAINKKYKHNNKMKEKKSKIVVQKNYLMIILIILLAIVFIITSGAFNISKIIVEGNKNISEEQVISFSKIQIGTNLFAISNKNIKNNLKENSYINDVQIKRIFPNKIKLIIDERNIDFVLELANGYVYIDKQRIHFKIFK